jgi:hypothetical protein
MSLFPLQSQFAPDLHLENPLVQPSYVTYNISIYVSNLCLLVDIGLVKEARLFTFPIHHLARECSTSSITTSRIRHPSRKQFGGFGRSKKR